MTDYTKGGYGKRAPYETQMYRIPTAIKETVQQLAAAYKRLCDSEIPSLHLLKQTQTAIAKAAYPQGGMLEETHDNLISSKKDDAIKQLETVRQLVDKWKGNAKDTRNWVEANRLLKELEAALSTQDK